MKIFWLVLLLFIYILIIYRIYFKKGKTYFRENVGLLMLTIIVALTQECIHSYKILVSILSIDLILIAWRRLKFSQGQFNHK